MLVFDSERPVSRETLQALTSAVNASTRDRDVASGALREMLAERESRLGAVFREQYEKGFGASTFAEGSRATLRSVAGELLEPVIDKLNDRQRIDVGRHFFRILDHSGEAAFEPVMEKLTSPQKQELRDHIVCHRLLTLYEAPDDSEFPDEALCVLLALDKVLHGIILDASEYGVLQTVLGSEFAQAVFRKSHGCNVFTRWLAQRMSLGRSFKLLAWLRRISLGHVVAVVIGLALLAGGLREVYRSFHVETGGYTYFEKGPPLWVEREGYRRDIRIGGVLILLIGGGLTAVALWDVIKGPSK